MHRPTVNGPRTGAQQRAPFWMIFGLGATGLSCARFLAGRGIATKIIDTRAAPPHLATLRQELPEIIVSTVDEAASQVAAADTLVLSPGVALDHPLVELARRAGVAIVGDIELFARHATAPYVAITGSNGKSTVTTLVAAIIAAAGHTVKAGANLGTPALELLTGPTPDYFALELSSFQLELTENLAPEVACVLNIAADHLDRHHTLDAYMAAKARIVRHAKCVIANADDPLVGQIIKSAGCVPVRWVSLRAAAATQYSIVEREGERWLGFGDQLILRTAELQIKGSHNEFNALAAVAITDQLNISRTAQIAALMAFGGLEHRCRLVGERDGVSWFNDSKGTNIGAASAAIAGIFDRRGGVLIAGGQGKGADFRELRSALIERIHTVILIGEDAPKIAAAIDDLVTIKLAADMRQAVASAAHAARAGEAVLLSPACASFDMFRNYEARGHAFEAAVRELFRT